MKNINFQLKSVLKKRYDDKRLASVYILHYDSNKINPDDWSKEFLSQLTTVKDDHPDVLVIKRAEDEKDYKVDGQQWSKFQSFIQYRPLVLKNKFVFIHDAHRISDIISNKLLKTFEDSPKELTIFLFLKDQQSLLPTIESRSIALQIDSSKDHKSSTQFTNFENPTRIIHEIKSHDDGEAIFLNDLVDNILLKDPNYKQISELLSSLKNNEKYAEFNNSQASRIALILP